MMFSPSFKIDASYKDFAAIRHWSELYQLSLLIRPTGIQYAIFDPDSGRFIAIEEASLKSTSDEGDFPGLLPQYLASEEWARRPYQTVNIGFETPWTTLIPSGLFDATRLEDFLEFIFHLPQGTSCKADHLQSQDCYNVWGADPAVLMALAHQFPGAAHRHHMSVLASRLPLAYPRDNPGDRVFLGLRKRHFDLLIYRDSRLEFINAFAYQQPEDILYYLLFVFEQKHVDKSQAGILVLGDLPGSQGLDLLNPYFPGLAPAGMPARLRASAALEGLPWSRYFTLTQLHLCE